jgi:DNA-binding transcriptional MerR regulator
MLEPDLTLEDLSERTGVETRTLRSWVSEGLLAPPLKAGRGARYPASNADRALAVRALKDLHGLSLAEIGRRFMMASQEQIRDWALEAGTTSAPPGSARDYLVRLRASSAPQNRQSDPWRRRGRAFRVEMGPYATRTAA